MIGYSLPLSTVHNNNAEILDSMRCPLSLQVFKEPVILIGDNRTYEYDLITKWISEHNTSPITREVIISPTCLENRTLKELVTEYLATKPHILYSDVQYLSSSIVVDFHNALLGYISINKQSKKGSVGTPAEILSYVSTLLDNEPRLVLITFESQHEKISAFQFACKHSLDEIIRVMYERIKVIYKINHLHCKGLFRGVLRGKFVGLVQQALKNPNPDDFELLKTMGITANFMFLTAASALDRECIQRSIERGASPTVKGKNGFTALMEAVVHMNSAVIPYLVEECHLPIKPALPYAFLYRKNDILGYFLKKDIRNIPTIHLLLLKEYLDDWGRDRMLDLMKKIIELPSNRPTVSSNTNFLNASDTMSSINNTAENSIDVLDADRCTPLHNAIKSNMPELVRILLQLGANPAYPLSSNSLHLVAKLGDDCIMKDLLDYLHNPNDINTSDSNGNTPLDIAMEYRHNGVIKLLLTSPRCNVNVNFSKIKDLSIVNPESVQLLLRKKLKTFPFLNNNTKNG